MTVLTKKHYLSTGAAAIGALLFIGLIKLSLPPQPHQVKVLPTAVLTQAPTNTPTPTLTPTPTATPTATPTMRRVFYLKK